MWELLLALVLIGILYGKTINYCNLIDDGVAMKDTLYVVPTSTPSPDFFVKKSPLKNRLWAIGVHMMNTCWVYLLLGGHAALLFAVFPISVNNVAWITGSYYSTATFLTLAAYYLLTHAPWFISMPVSMALFGAALNATIVTISFPFVFLFTNPIGLCTLAPLGFFLIGKRFTAGIKIREAFAKHSHFASDTFTPRRLVVCLKVVAYYLYLTLVPVKLVFFHAFGNRFLFDDDQRRDLMAVNKMFFASLALIGTFIWVGFIFHKIFWCMWFLVLIGAFSQYRILGQFFAERYMYPATIGVIALLACLPDQVFWVLVGAYIVRTFMFIPSFRCNGTLYETGTAFEPTEPSNFCNLSDWHLLVEPDLSLAGYYAQKTIQIDPSDFKPHVNMSSLFMCLRNYPFALVEAKTALRKAEGKTSEQFINIICNQIYKIQGMMNETEKQLNPV